MTIENTKAPFITFYSFKGGVGRSMALINTAVIMAERGFRVLVIDMDLEAPGLSFLMQNTSNTGIAALHQAGFIELLADVKERGGDADLFELPVEQMLDTYACKYAGLQIMPAGKLDENYTQRFDALNLRGLYEEDLGEPLIRTLKKRLAESGLVDFVLIDSRTGFSDEAGVCTRDLADYLVILSGLNKQNVEGSSNFLRVLKGATDGQAKFQIVLSPMPNGEDELANERKKAAQKAFDEAWGQPVELSLEIPYHPRLALTEEPHIVRQKSGFLADAYHKIEKQVLAGMGLDVQTLLPKLAKAIRGQAYAPALQMLRQFVRLDEAEANVSKLMLNLFLLNNLRSMAEDKTSPSIEQMLNHLVGREVVAFLLNHVSCDMAEFGADFLLKQLRELDFELADVGYQRFIASNPKEAYLLGNYASFLIQYRGDVEQAQVFYLRAIDADPKRTTILSNYAIFLVKYRGDVEQAQVFCLRAIEADPKDAYNLGNYGQLLTGNGQFSQAEEQLLAGVAYIDSKKTEVLAELCFSLWLCTRLQNKVATPWLQGFKFYLQQGFKRTPWNFDRMLAQAEKLLPPEELRFAQALAAAFLDANQLAALEHFEPWQTLPAKPVK